MEGYLFMESVLQYLSQGRVWRRGVGLLLQFLAIVAVSWGLVQWFSMWRYAARAAFFPLVGLVIFQLLFLVTIYMVAHTLYLRGRNCTALPEAKYQLIPIFALIIKAFGEAYASVCAVMGLGGGVLVWLMGGYARSLVKKGAPLLPHLGSGYGFMGGLAILIGGALMASASLIFSYTASEILHLVAAVGEDIEVIRAHHKGGKG